MNNPSFYLCDSYEDRTALRRAVRGIFADSFGDGSFFQNKKVVVKPNLVMKKAPEGGATTHPALLEEILVYLKEKTADVSVAECPGGLSTEVILESIYRVTGIREVCDRLSVPIVLDQTAVTVRTRDAFCLNELSLLDTMVKADVLVNIGKLKSHSLTTFTACAKNLYGAIPGLSKVEYHARFAEVDVFSDLICDINRTLPATVSFLDAVVGMEGNGPTGGQPRKIGAVLGGRDPFAVDSFAARLIGLDPLKTPILAAAARHGLLPEDLSLLGDAMEGHVLTDFKLADAQRFSILREMPNLKVLRRFLEPRPVISDRCVGCGECVKLCPKKTIVLHEKNGCRRAKIQKRACIRCYCCQELCPAKAVDTKSMRIMKL